MARFDKYEPFSGGFRVRLAADFITPADFEKIWAVTVNSSGLAVLKGAVTAATLRGVTVITGKKYAGDVIDVMSDGEIVEVNSPTTISSTPGIKLYATAADGSATVTSASNFEFGFTVEAERVIVRVPR
jgi:hypothetical protein